MGGQGRAAKLPTAPEQATGRQPPGPSQATGQTLRPFKPARMACVRVSIPSELPPKPTVFADLGGMIQSQVVRVLLPDAPLKLPRCSIAQFSRSHTESGLPLAQPSVVLLTARRTTGGLAQTHAQNLALNSEDEKAAPPGPRSRRRWAPSEPSKSAGAPKDTRSQPSARTDQTLRRTSDQGDNHPTSALREQAKLAAFWPHCISRRRQTIINGVRSSCRSAAVLSPNENALIAFLNRVSQVRILPGAPTEPQVSTMITG